MDVLGTRLIVSEMSVERAFLSKINSENAGLFLENSTFYVCLHRRDFQGLLVEMDELRLTEKQC